MTLANTTLVPELQYWFNQYVQNSSINRYEIPMPVPVPPLFLKSNSVVALLFNKEYQHTDFIYNYREETQKLCWPEMVRQRLMLYPSSKYLVADSSGTNIFDIQYDALVMLDALNVYRNDSTSLVMIDTTGLSLITDATSNTAILYTMYDSLTTKLAKLIYLYLDLQVRSNYENYNNINIITCGTLLETCFEAFVLDAYFDFMTNIEAPLGMQCPLPPEPIQ